ncbi:S49 family peptidase [Tautonia sociabilis]|uniref:S49 family peptidase n=1 Tax=Tautonia sociabilis TaxID=2080755 RepID=A0A432MJL3_9BACT|nr:S49 family peptidase [Tautonia sociabilis]RUL87440.1 S49 family peptidase [Tautonia sociabilis]
MSRNRHSRPCSAPRAWLAAVLLAATAGVGCGQVPVVGRFDTQSTFRGHTDVAATVSAVVDGPIELSLPTVPDPGPIVAVPIRAGASAPGGPRVAIVDVDGLLLNRSPTGPYSAGENPVEVFRERLEAVAADPTIRAVVVRINSPGGSVTASDIMAEELDRFRERTRLPVVCCLMDLGTAGAYYLAVGGDRVLAHPTTITGGIGALLNRFDLSDAIGQIGAVSEPITSGSHVAMGNLGTDLPEETEALLQSMVDGFAARFRGRVALRRPRITAEDWEVLDDGRVVPASEAIERGLIDGIGYLDDAIAEAERLAGVTGAEVVLLKRKGDRAHSIYSVTPNRPIQDELFPVSYPGLDRSKLPTFLYLWSPDPTLLTIGGP